MNIIRNICCVIDKISVHIYLYTRGWHISELHLEIIVNLLVFNTFYTAIPLHPSHPPSDCQPDSQREKVTLLQLYESFTLLIYGLLTLSAPQITQHKIITRPVNNKLERILKEAAVVLFEPSSRDMPGGIEENQNKPPTGDRDSRL